MSDIFLAVGFKTICLLISVVIVFVTELFLAVPEKVI